MKTVQTFLLFVLLIAVNTYPQNGDAFGIGVVEPSADTIKLNDLTVAAVEDEQLEEKPSAIQTEALNTDLTSQSTIENVKTISSVSSTDLKSSNIVEDKPVATSAKPETESNLDVVSGKLSESSQTSASESSSTISNTITKTQRSMGNSPSFNSEGTADKVETTSITDANESSSTPSNIVEVPQSSILIETIPTISGDGASQILLTSPIAANESSLSEGEIVSDNASPDSTPNLAENAPSTINISIANPTLNEVVSQIPDQTSQTDTAVAHLTSTQTETTPKASVELSSTINSASQISRSLIAAEESSPTEQGTNQTVLEPLNAIATPDSSTNLAETASESLSSTNTFESNSTLNEASAIPDQTSQTNAADTRTTQAEKTPTLAADISSASDSASQLSTSPIAAIESIPKERQTISESQIATGNPDSTTISTVITPGSPRTGSNPALNEASEIPTQTSQTSVSSPQIETTQTIAESRSSARIPKSSSISAETTLEIAESEISESGSNLNSTSEILVTLSPIDATDPGSISTVIASQQNDESTNFILESSSTSIKTTVKSPSTSTTPELSSTSVIAAEKTLQTDGPSSTQGFTDSQSTISSTTEHSERPATESTACIGDCVTGSVSFSTFVQNSGKISENDDRLKNSTVVELKDSTSEHDELSGIERSIPDLKIITTNEIPTDREPKISDLPEPVVSAEGPLISESTIPTQLPEVTTSRPEKAVTSKVQPAVSSESSSISESTAPIQVPEVTTSRPEKATATKSITVIEPESVPTSELADSKTTTSTSSSSSRSLPCTEEGHFSDSTNCRRFTTCTSNATDLIRTKNECPEGLAFSPAVRRCTRDISPCQEKPICLQSGSIPDPTTPSSYYWCVSSLLGGFHKYHIQCSSDEVFNALFGRCLLKETKFGPISPFYGIPNDRATVRYESKLMKKEIKTKLKEEKNRQKMEAKAKADAEKCAQKKLKKQNKSVKDNDDDDDDEYDD